MSLLPEPNIEFHWRWFAPHYGPACVTVGDNLRAHASHIEVTIYPDGTDPDIKVEGYIMTQKGLRDRRHSYAKLCSTTSVGDAVWEEIGEVIQAKISPS